jgi:hypothetical protein
MNQAPGQYLRFEWKIIWRYLKPHWSLVSIAVMLILWMVFEKDDLPIGDSGVIYILEFLLVSFFTFFINDFFWGGKEEVRCRLLYPTEFRQMVLVKNLLMIGILSVSIGLLQLGSALALSIQMENILRGWLYFGSVIFLLTTIGNASTIRTHRKKTGTGIGTFYKHGFIFLLVSLPFVILVMVLRTTLPCLIYVLFTALWWYFRSVARTAHRLQHLKYQLLEDA